MIFNTNFNINFNKHVLKRSISMSIIIAIIVGLYSYIKYESIVVALLYSMITILIMFIFSTIVHLGYRIAVKYWYRHYMRKTAKIIVENNLFCETLSNIFKQKEFDAYAYDIDYNKNTIMQKIILKIKG